MTIEALTHTLIAIQGNPLALFAFCFCFAIAAMAWVSKK